MTANTLVFRIVRAFAIASCAVLLAACQTGRASPAPRPIAARPLPSIETILDAQNQRVDGLTSLWARITLRVDGKLANAKLNKEEAEGYLQVVLPRKVAVQINKVGSTYFYLGSNDELYWWLDLTEAKRGYFGRHAKATPDTVDQFGLPVHPLDLIELLAITPIDAGTLAEDSQHGAHWSTDGKLVWYDTTARAGTKRVLVDPKTLLPEFVELLDSSGKVIVSSELSKYTEYQSLSKPTARPSVPARCIVRVPRSELTITINLNDPNGRQPKPVAFDFIKLATELYPVPKLIDLDKKEDGDAK